MEKRSWLKWLISRRQFGCDMVICIMAQSFCTKDELMCPGPQGN